jgi:hypothetical protein
MLMVAWDAERDFSLLVFPFRSSSEKEIQISDFSLQVIFARRGENDLQREEKYHAAAG